MAYTYAEKIAILEYARDNGTIAAAQHFGIASSTVVRWNRKYQIYETQIMRTFSVEQKIAILQYANTHGLTNAMNHYAIDVATLQKWNEKLHIYQKNSSRRVGTTNKLPNRETAEYKISVLEYARDFGPSAASREYGVAPSTIRLWNNEYHVYTPRKHRTFSPEQRAAIIAVASKDGIAHAARQFNVTSCQIQDWITKENQK